MTLIKKLLTASLPVALVGVVTPTIASCSCHKDSFTLKYKDPINCLDKKEPNYHKHGDVANAVKVHAYKMPREEIDKTFLTSFSAIWNTEYGQQMFYWDLAASCVILADQNINLNSWNVVENKATFTIKGALQSEQYSDAVLSYTYSPKFGITLSIAVSGQSAELLRSYMFSDCTYKEG